MIIEEQYCSLEGETIEKWQDKVWLRASVPRIGMRDRHSNSTTNQKRQDEIGVQHFALKKGLNLPITGAPVSEEIHDGGAVSTVALLGGDYIGLKPRISVSEGDVVAAGDPVFAHKDSMDVKVVAPVSGRSAFRAS